MDRARKTVFFYPVPPVNPVCIGLPEVVGKSRCFFDRINRINRKRKAVFFYPVPPVNPVCFGL